METIGSSDIPREILNEVWDRHPEDAIEDFLKIYNQIKEERKSK